MLPLSSFAPFLAYHAGFIGESYFLPPLKTTLLIKNAEKMFSVTDTLQIAVVIGRFVFLVFFA